MCGLKAKKPVDPASLVVVRVVVGTMGAISAARYFWYGWIDRFFYQRDFFFHFPGFEWVQPLPAPGMHIVFGALVALGVLIAIGLFYRASTALFLVLFTYVGLIDTTNYLNHYWFFRFVLFLMVFMPMAEAGSVDAWWRERRSGEPPAQSIPAWPVWVLRAQIGLLYFFAGVGKLQPDWLLHGQPMDLWLSARTHFPLVGPWFATEWLPHAMSVAGAAFDLTIVGWLLWPRTRPFAYVAVVVFHAATGWLFNIGMFPVIMIGLTPIFFSPSWPRRWLPAGWVGALRLPSSSERDSTSADTLDVEATWGWFHTTRRQRLLWAGLAIWFAIQIAMPLRHALYPGKARWTHEGFRFSWRVKLIEKAGYLTYRVRNPETDETWRVEPSQYLSKRQQQLAAADPQKILQLAHHIARDFKSKGYGTVEVYADAWASLNGRPNQRLIDPDVDLTDQRRSIWHDDWILPLDTPIE